MKLCVGEKSFKTRAASNFLLCCGSCGGRTMMLIFGWSCDSFLAWVD
ncbi:MAG: hypothetical protein LBF66_02780 [Holosporales bacterium]|nr:hypothetical protein [Holosporales bacterium]